MKIETDKRANAIYIYLQNKEDIVKPLKTKEIGSGVYVDIDANGDIFGIELLGYGEVEIEEISKKS